MESFYKTMSKLLMKMMFWSCVVLKQYFGPI